MAIQDKNNNFLINPTNEFEISDYIKKNAQIVVLYGNVGSNIVFSKININSGETALPFEPYKEPQALIVQTPNGLPGIPVSSGGNYTDENGQQWIADYVDFGSREYVQFIGVIESYNSENVGETYMSTTGQLSSGAKVQYVLSEPVRTPLSEEQIQAFRALHTNSPTTTIMNDADVWMKAKYKVRR